MWKVETHGIICNTDSFLFPTPVMVIVSIVLLNSSSQNRDLKCNSIFLPPIFSSCLGTYFYDPF